MIRIFALLILTVCLISPAAAAEINTYGLTEQQQAELALQAAKMKAEDPTKVADRMAEYAEIGQKYGVALAATAKELGVAADELLDTMVGKVALVLIVWKVMGEELIGILIGIPYMVIGFLAWFYMFRRLCVIESITRTPVEGRWLRKKIVTYHSPASETTWGVRWVMLFSLALGILVPSFLMIF